MTGMAKWHFDWTSFNLGILAMGIFSPFFQPTADKIVSWIVR